MRLPACLPALPKSCVAPRTSVTSWPFGGVILSAFDSNPALPEIDVPDRILQLVLNLGSEDADTLLMGPIVNDELSEVGMAGLHAPLRSRSKASSEVASLRAKVSLLAMQKH